MATALSMGSPLARAPALRRSLARIERRRRALALALTLPLLVFLLLVIVVPLGALLTRAVENPEVAGSLSRTSAALAGWDGQSAPPARAYAAVVADLSVFKENAPVGAVARRLNSDVPGARSLIMSTFRALPLGDSLTPEQTRDQMLALDPRWGELAYWRAIARNASRWTPDYLLASVDLRRGADGSLQAVPPDQRVYAPILLRTFEISAVVTFWCLLLGYPLAYWLSTLPPRKANLMLIMVLVPFWTSILVRVAAWIVLLQREGLINKSLLGLGVVAEPVPLLFNRVGVVIAMVHILLPFMILPLYSVMKSVPPTYVRAAVSLGSSPAAAFLRVYVPQTYAGVGAGALLVFILSIGYYVTPALLGGPNDQMLSYYIARYTNVEVNWGMACAMGSVLLAATLALYAGYRRVASKELSLG